MHGDHSAVRCVFCRVVRGDAPASVVYHDELVTAFMDIGPVNPGHLLVVPNAHAASLADLTERDGQHIFPVGQRLAMALRRSGIRCDGVNLFLADGEAAGQDVFHVHLHVLPRFVGDGLSPARFFGKRSPSTPSREELDVHAAAIRGALQATGSSQQ